MTTEQNRPAPDKKYFVQIVAVDENYGIGYKDKLLFHIPKDLEQFKILTLNQTIVAGTKTAKTLPKLHDRHLVQFTRNPKARTAHYSEGVVNDIKSSRHYSRGAPGEYEPIFIIGGGEVYKETLPETSIIILTRIFSRAKNADTYYFDPLTQERRPLYYSCGQKKTCDKTGHEYRFEIYGYNEIHLREFLKYKHKRLKDGPKRDFDTLVCKQRF